LKSRPTFTKRNRERAREEKRKLKEEKREIRKEESAARAAEAGDEEDPDIAGIVPGPQKLDPELFGLPDEIEERSGGHS
jgi:hypothetical protein